MSRRKKQYHKRFYLYGKTVLELLDKVNEVYKIIQCQKYLDVSITEVLDKQIEIQQNFSDDEVDNNNSFDNIIKTTIFKYSYYAIVIILIED